jgi:hypothetical protein
MLQSHGWATRTAILKYIFSTLAFRNSNFVVGTPVHEIRGQASYHSCINKAQAYLLPTGLCHLQIKKHI